MAMVAYNMRREIPRTLFTISPSYQRDIQFGDCEVIVVDNGSRSPLHDCDVDIPSLAVRLAHYAGSSSPAAAMNYAASLCTGDVIFLCIDGARMFSPRIISLALQALQARPGCIVGTLGWHLGPKPQSFSIDDGYNQEVEDRLLASVDWRSNGYELFRISSLAGSSDKGWLMPISESNCLAMSRQTYEKTGGFDEKFECAGGGLVNLDFYRRSCELTQDLVLLLGEGTFHQFHGGVSTNVPRNKSPFSHFHDEYVRLRGYPFKRPTLQPIFWGGMPAQCLEFLQLSIDAAR